MSLAIMDDRLKRNDYWLLGLICLAFFSHTLFIGRVFSLHEAILPQTSREMLADHDWIVPKNGGRPWLEKPPLPQWITVGVLTLVGHADSEWPYRLAPIFCGTLTVLLVAWMASCWFGRGIGWLSGLVLATTWDFVRYSTYAEADIFLCLIVTAALAVFVHAQSALLEQRNTLLGARSVGVWLFFALLGLTNLAKGLAFGAAMVVIPIASWICWNRDGTAARRYLWLWGGLLFMALAAAWPLGVSLRHPDAWQLWFDDGFKRMSEGFIGNPPWYYAEALTWILLPWTPFVLVGLGLTARTSWRAGDPATRFVWCWAVLPPLVFSIPDGKHHHYLLHCLAPWAILGALGLRATWQWVQSWPGWLRRPEFGMIGYGAPAVAALLWFRAELPGPDWFAPALCVLAPGVILLLCWCVLKPNARQAASLGFCVVMILYVVGLAYKANWIDLRLPDTELFAEVKPMLDDSKPVFVNAEQEGLETLRAQFYLGGQSRVLHNLTYLLDEQIKERELYLLTRTRDEPRLADYGAAELLLQSERARREQTSGDRWALYRLNLRDGLPRRPAPAPSTMQTADRAPGPYLNPAERPRAGSN